MNEKLQALFEVAKTSKKVGRARIVAGVVYKDRFVAIASNSYKSHPKQKALSKSEDKICLHAEVDAILKARKLLGEKKLREATILVARARFDGNKMVHGLAKPCAICQELINEYEMKVIYTC